MAISTAGVLLAAGRSTRMGGRSKLLSEFRGKPLVLWAAEALAKSGLGEVVVVLGPDPAPLRALLCQLPVRIVENQRFSEGMATSLVAGIASLGPDVTLAVVALGDMPLLSPDLVKRLVGAVEDSSKSVAVPVYGGRRGHPVVFGLERHRRALLGLTGDQGARALLTACPDEVLEFPVEDPAVLLDIDTPEQLASLEEGSPSAGEDEP